MNPTSRNELVGTTEFRNLINNILTDELATKEVVHHKTANTNFVRKTETSISNIQLGKLITK